MEGAVAQALRDGGGEALRLYVAACAERMAPLFMGLRANAPGRESDLEFYAKSVRDLWYADRPLADAAGLRGASVTAAGRERLRVVLGRLPRRACS
ncbi:hypothetical protein ACFWMU_01450 [Streptomyces sp. NPDC058357]|uniref:hypothetical protein n=1 Tax=unclassified Streptomyces TaxID=2593676 RepID=UPI00365DCA1E